MVNINNVEIFITFFIYGKNQLNVVHMLIKIHSTTDQNMGSQPMLVRNFQEQHLVPLNVYIKTKSNPQVWYVTYCILILNDIFQDIRGSKYCLLFQAYRFVLNRNMFLNGINTWLIILRMVSSINEGKE